MSIFSIAVGTWLLLQGRGNPEVDHFRYSECIQEAGDALIVPDSWGHAVINLRSSVAVALEVAPVNVNH